MKDNRKVTKPLDPKTLEDRQEKHGRGYEDKAGWVDRVIVTLIVLIFVLTLYLLMGGAR